MESIKVSDSGVKTLFDWFSDNFPRCEMVIRNAPNGFCVLIKETTENGDYYGQKVFIFNTDYTIDDNVFDLIRAAVPVIIEGINEYKKAGNN